MPAVQSLDSKLFSENIHKYHLGLSISYTIINIILTMMMYACIFSYFLTFDNTFDYISEVSIFNVPVLILSLICNMIFLLIGVKCCCSCCCDTECHKPETYVIDTHTVKLDIIKIEDRYDHTTAIF